MYTTRSPLLSVVAKLGVLAGKTTGSLAKAVAVVTGTVVVVVDVGPIDVVVVTGFVVVVVGAAVVVVVVVVVDGMFDTASAFWLKIGTA